MCIRDSGENIYVAHNIDVGKAIRYVLSGLKQQVMYEVRVFGYSRGGDGLQSHPTLEFVLGETGWHTVLIRSFPRYSVTCTSVRRGFKNQIFRTSTQKTQDGDWLPWKWRLGQESRFNRCQPGLHSCVCDCVLYNLFCSVLIHCQLSIWSVKSTRFIHRRSVFRDLIALGVSVGNRNWECLCHNIRALQRKETLIFVDLLILY